jgi:hypothetical protein
MRNIRTARICARAAIALAVLSAVGSATAAPRAVFLEALPAIATGAGQTVVAWTAGGVVQIASQNSDGSFTPGSAVGRTLGSQSPQIAITPAGEQVLVWQSGRTLRSAVRYSPQTAWKLQKIAGAGRFVDPHLVMGPTGRAIVTWVTDTGAPSTTSSLWESTRLPHESWSAPVLLVGPAILAGGSTAVDSDGDVAVVYASVPSFGPNAGSERFSVWAIELAAGADAWTPPVVISGADVLGSNGPFVAGGGSRTFVATWRAANVAPKAPSEPESLLHTARLRLPGAWEAPQTLVAPESKLSAFANAGLGAVGVDSAGDALAIVRYGSSEHGLALDSVRLPSTADAWDAPVVVDVPERVEMNDSPPALVLGQNASATVVFLRGLLVGTTLRVAALAAGGAWQGQGTDLAQLDSCSKSLYPDGSITCPLGAETVPVVASGSPVSVVAV